MRTADGLSLFIRQAEPQGAVRATVFLVHGMGEHSSRYFHVANRLLERGYRVSTFDLRGHGRSAGKRGDIKTYSELLDDLSLVWEKSDCHRAEIPVFLYGHSLGGQIAINFAAQRKPAVRGVIAASPWLDLAFTPAWWKLALAHATRVLWPGFTQRTPVNPSRLSRDQEFLLAMPDLDLVHHWMSARMFFELTVGAAIARKSATQFTFPLLLLHGAADLITSPMATETFFNQAAVKDKTLHIYPETLHETHNDLNRDAVVGDIIRWLDDRCG